MVTFQSIGEAVIVTDISGRIEYLNPVAEKFLDCSETEVRKMELFKLCQIVDETNGRASLDLVANVSGKGPRGHVQA